MHDKILSEAKRLWNQGWGIHWLHSKAKRPIESKWTTGPRASWKHLLSTYRPGMNVGVRLGEASKIGERYLACIDIDVKDEGARNELEAAAAGLTGGVPLEMFPNVRSGAGKHIYFLTRDPFKMRVILKKPGLGEVAVYSAGRQMVLPPSVHPTGRLYKWLARPAGAPPMIDLDALARGAGPGATTDRVILDLKAFPKVDLDWLGISDVVRAGIESGAGVEDRSAFLMPATTALLSAGLEKEEVLSVLTDPTNFISGCAYDHAKTRNRRRAAEWLWRYTVRGVVAGRSGEGKFKPVGPEGVVNAELSFDEMVKQDVETEEGKDWRSELKRAGPKGGGTIKPLIENIDLIFRHAVSPELVKRDLFAWRDFFTVNAPWGSKKGEAIEDQDLPKIKLWLGREFDFEPGKDLIADTLLIMAASNAFDPVKDALEALPPWDERPRLDTWLKKHFGARGDKEYLAQVFRKWIVAMVMRVYEPGVKFDWMPIFEGPQGIGKSSFGEILVGNKQFLDSLPNLADKDAALGLQGMWAVEMGELSQFRKNEVETIKAFITRTVDKIRPPYGRRWIESPRRCVFFGTTNRDQYLRDETGNRRFKPVVVTQLDFDALRRDRDQLFAEALALYRSKKENRLSLYLDGQALEYEAKLHQEKMVADEAVLMAESMSDFIENNPEFDIGRFRLLDLFQGMGPFGKWRPDQKHMQLAAKTLKQLGGEKRKIQGNFYWKLEKGDRF